MQPELDKRGHEIRAIVKKHPFGIVALYIQAGIGIVAAFGLVFLLLPEFVTEETRLQYGALAAIALVAISAITALILLLATYIYRQSQLVITDQDLVQTIQRGLFNRQVSELSMASIEDVTSDQRGIFASLLGFGTLNIETAGEQNNFRFTYCPRPNYYANIVLEAREQYVNSDPVRAKRSNSLLEVPRG